MKKHIAYILFVNFVKTLLNTNPKVGDKIKVAVGYSSIPEEGIVESVHDTYCWIKRINPSLKHDNFTASLGYCKFIYIV